MKTLKYPPIHPSRILAMVNLIGAVTLILAPTSHASAQVSYPSWNYTDNLTPARRFHTATLLPNGKVLVAGGFDPTTCSVGGCRRLDSAMLYDPTAGTWTSTGSLNRPREEHTATLLPSGKVLVAGGDNSGVSAELYDPAAGTWSITGNLHTSRFLGHTATLLSNGKVLVAGGWQGFNQYTSGAELYDPATGIWTITGSLNTARSGAATLLPNGKVLVSGGESSNSTNLFSLNSAELYEPITGTWSFTGSLSTSRLVHTSTLLPNGKVLVTGGNNRVDNNTGTVISSAELYDPTTGTWSSAGDLNSSLFFHTATLLPNGKVLIAGGIGNVAVSTAELYEPATNTWTTTAYLNSPRWSHIATLLTNGKVLVAGGIDNDLNSTELYDPSSSPNINIIDDVRFFVHQHYIDFLKRDPDPDGGSFWTNEITSCGSEVQCTEIKRINVSAAFFLSIEFQETGYFVYRVHKAAHGNFPNAPVPIRLSEFQSEAQEMGQNVVVGQPGWEQILESNKQSFLGEADGESDRFTSAFPPSMTPSEFVDALFTNAEVIPTPGERLLAINEFGSANATTDLIARARALHRVAENPALKQQEFNRAFVLMQYFSYLRRNPNDLPDTSFAGYNFWVGKLDQFNGNFIEAEMVKAFISSVEYRRRFGQP